MLVTPSAQVKTLASCDAGELVLVDHGGENVLALTARMPEGTEPWLVYLRSSSQRSPATFGVSAPFHKAVSFGKSYSLRVDPTASIEIRPRWLYESSGAICLFGAQWRLSVFPEPGHGLYDSYHYVLETGKLVATPNVNELAAFPKWEIRLGDNAEETEKRSEPFFALDLTRAAKA